jgi:hypothetical protein
VALLKILLSGITTITLLLIGGPIVMMYPAIRAEKATGLAAVAGGLTEALHTPLFWFAGVLFFFLFWWVGRLHSKILRVLLFWVPTVLLTVVGSLIFALVMYAYMHRPNG